jgi:hypothetical protein
MYGAQANRNLSDSETGFYLAAVRPHEERAVLKYNPAAVAEISSKHLALYRLSYNEPTHGRGSYV